jgi:hypothetical protein
MGSLLPSDVQDLIVAEKSISVSNLMNGATRLQPVVMQIGQASGALAALAVIEGKHVKNIGVRQLQEKLLDDGCYIMPYLDLPEDHRHFRALQRIGATGILKGEGRNEGWSNETWFRAYDPLLLEEVDLDDYYGNIALGSGKITIGLMLDLVRTFGGKLPYGDSSEWWRQLGLDDYDAGRTVTRLEAAVVIDAAFDPFGMFEVDYEGDVLK